MINIDNLVGCDKIRHGLFQKPSRQLLDWVKHAKSWMGRDLLILRNASILVVTKSEVEVLQLVSDLFEEREEEDAPRTWRH